MEVKYNSDNYKIISRENNKSGREVDVALKIGGTGHGQKTKMLMEILFRTV